MNKEKKHEQPNEINQLQKTCDEYLNGWKRAKADYENLKKQTLKEKEEFVKFANLNLILHLIPVYENFKIAFNHVPDNLNKTEWLIGIRHIKEQFKKILGDYDVEEIIPQTDDNFNPEEHEAVEQGEVANLSADGQVINNKIKEVISAGYKLKGKIILPAKVIVK